MGDRGQVYIEDTGVYLYVHWRAPELCELVAAGLAHRKQWTDPGYLTRIVYEAVSDGGHPTRSFSITTKPAGDAWRTVRINVAEQEITVNDDHLAADGTEEETYGFEAFVEEFEGGKA